MPIAGNFKDNLKPPVTITVGQARGHGQGPHSMSMSLSMQLRTESVLADNSSLGGRGLPSISSRFTSLTGSSRYDVLLAGAGAGAGHGAAPGVRKSEEFGKPKNQFSRLSGLYDSMATEVSASGFPDRHKFSKPSVVCRRCAEPATLCTSCNESLCGDAVQFFRETRAEGALVFFNKAIVACAESKIAKFIVFTQWNRLTQKEKRLQNSRIPKIELLFRNTNTIDCFRAWRSFVRESIKQRTEKMTDDLLAKVSTLEKYIENSNADKMNQEYTIKELRNEIKQLSTKLKSANDEVDELKATNARERSRVLGLCKLVDPLLTATSIVQESSQREAIDTATALLHQAMCVQGTSFADMDASALSTTLITAMSIDPIKYDPLPKELEPFLIQWVQLRSAGASLQQLPDGKSLDLYLPPENKLIVVRSLADFKEGKMLARAICDVLYDCCHARLHNTDTSKSSDAHHVVYPSVAATAMRGYQRGCEVFTADELEQLKKLKSAGCKALMEFALKHLVAHLNAPALSSFKIDDIAAGNPAAIARLVLYLIYRCESVMPKTDRAVLAKSAGALEACFDESREQLLEVSGATNGGLKDIRRLWRSYFGLTEDTTEAKAEPNEVVEEAGAESQPSNSTNIVADDNLNEANPDSPSDGPLIPEASEPQDETVTDLESAAPVVTSESDASSSAVVVSDNDPEVIAAKQLQTYADLAAKIDVFVLTSGSTADASDLPVLESFRNLNTTLQRFAARKDEIIQLRVNADTRVKLSNELRQSIARKQLEASMLK